MRDTSETNLPLREILYQRERSKNRIYDQLVSYFAERAERDGLTKRDIANALGREPSSITRWLAHPSNLTIETVSDLLLAMGAEADLVVRRFDESPKANFIHEWMAEYDTPPPKGAEPVASSGRMLGQSKDPQPSTSKNIQIGRTEVAAG